MTFHMPWKMPWNSIAGFCCGVVLTGWTIFYAPNWVAPITDAIDARNPVMTPVSADLVERDDDSIVVRIVSHKHFGTECLILRVYATAVGENGLPAGATVRRPNGDEHSAISYEAGVRDFGLWRVKPVLPGARSVTVYSEHSCLGRVRRSVIAEVPL